MNKTNIVEYRQIVTVAQDFNGMGDITWNSTVNVDFDPDEMIVRNISFTGAAVTDPIYYTLICTAETTWV